MGQTGLMGIPIPEEWGGAGADFVSYILALKEISKVSATVGVILAVHTSLGTMPILRYGTDAQRKKYVPRLASGEYLGAFALTEAHAGSDAGNIRTRALRKGNHYILNGSKVFITNAGEAEYVCCFCCDRPGCREKRNHRFYCGKGTPRLVIGKAKRKWV